MVSRKFFSASTPGGLPTHPAMHKLAVLTGDRLKEGWECWCVGKWLGVGVGARAGILPNLPSCKPPSPAAAGALRSACGWPWAGDDAAEEAEEDGGVGSLREWPSLKALQIVRNRVKPQCLR